MTAEGFSEEKFISDIVRLHLLNFNVYADVRKVLTNRKLRKRGGVVSYGKFKNDVTQWIKEQPDSFHTTLVDLYGLASDFPAYTQTQGWEPYKRVIAIEDAIKKDIGYSNFIPYIQLHEYEALLFSRPDVMEKWLSLYNRVPVGSFKTIVQCCGNNPELINEHPDTAPSKRILSICPIYDKVDDGILILKEIGLDSIRAQCAHFNEWLSMLENLHLL